MRTRQAGFRLGQPSRLKTERERNQGRYQMRRLVSAVLFPTVVIGFLASPSWGASVNAKTGVATSPTITDVAYRRGGRAGGVAYRGRGVAYGRRGIYGGRAVVAGHRGFYGGRAVYGRRGVYVGGPAYYPSYYGDDYYGGGGVYRRGAVYGARGAYVRRGYRGGAVVAGRRGYVGGRYAGGRGFAGGRRYAARGGGIRRR